MQLVAHSMLQINHGCGTSHAELLKRCNTYQITALSVDSFCLADEYLCTFLIHCKYKLLPFAGSICTRANSGS